MKLNINIFEIISNNLLPQFVKLIPKIEKLTDYRFLFAKLFAFNEKTV